MDTDQNKQPEEVKPQEEKAVETAQPEVVSQDQPQTEPVQEPSTTPQPVEQVPQKKVEETSVAESSEVPQDAPAEPIIVKNDNPNAKWYVIHVKTGYEQRVKKALQQRIKSLGVEDRIFDIIIPMREIVAVKKGKKSKVQEKVFPGYVLIRMILDDDSWLVVRTTEGVTGFVGAGLKPTPISEKEVEAIIQFVQQEQPKFKTKFAVGEAVKIIEGPFSDFLGTIEAIDDERGKVRVLISIFDRETPVELDFLQVSKL